MAAAVAAELVSLTNDKPTFNPISIVSVEPFSGGKVPLDQLSKIPANSVLLSIIGEQDDIAKDEDAKTIFDKTTNISTENKNFVKVNCDLKNKNKILFSCKNPSTDLTCPIEDNATNCLTAGHLAPLSYKEITEQTGEGNQLIAFLKSSLDISDVSSSDIPDVISYLVKLLKEMTEEEKERFLTAAFKANAIDYYSFWKLSVGLSNLAFHGQDREYALGNTDKQKDMGQWSDTSPVNKLDVTVNP